MKIEATIIAVAGVAILLQSDLKATFTTHLQQTLLPFFQTILASTFFSITFTIAKLLIAIFILRKLFLICYAPWTIIGFDEYKKVNDKGTYTPGASSVNSKDKRILGKFPHPYPTGWYKITDSVKLNKGDVQYHQALGQHLVLFRTEEGKACILDAYCPHLGANLGIDGRVVGNCVECAFHAWRFNGHTGKCDEIPYNPSSCTIPPQAKVKAWNVEECNGTIYMWFCADEEPPSWKVFDTPEIEDKSYSFLGKFEQMIDAHIQEIPENGADLAHLNFLHAPAVLSPIKALQHHWSLSWDLGEGPEEHSTSIHIVQKVLFNGNAIPGTTVGVKVRQYGPSLVKLELCMPFGRFIVMENVTPVGPLRQKVSHCFWAPKGVFFRVLGKFCMLAFYKQFTRDLIVWNNKKYVHNPLVVKNDGPILQFRRWFSRFYPKQEWKGEEDRPTVDPQKLEW